MHILIVVILIIVIGWFIVSYILKNILDFIMFIFYGRTFNKRDMKWELEKRQRELNRGAITQEQFDHFYMEIKRDYPDL
jgi:hypothetical protein